MRAEEANHWNQKQSVVSIRNSIQTKGRSVENPLY